MERSFSWARSCSFSFSGGLFSFEASFSSLRCSFCSIAFLRPSVRISGLGGTIHSKFPSWGPTAAYTQRNSRTGGQKPKRSRPQDLAPASKDPAILSCLGYTLDWRTFPHPIPGLYLFSIGEGSGQNNPVSGSVSPFHEFDCPQSITQK